MNRKLFNLKNAAKVAVLTLLAFIGFNSFKSANALSNKMITESWYYISNSTDPNTQFISGSPLSSLPPLGDCQQTYSGDICAIKLSFEEDEAPTLPSGTTVKQAVDNYGATVVSMGGNPVYAKHEIN